MSEPLTQEEINELVVYVSGTRLSKDKAHWFIGRRYVPDGKEPELIAESVRGDEDRASGTWQPIADERCACCDEIKGKDPFALLKHCATETHVRNLIERLSPERQKREYEYMLENVYLALTEDWGSE